MQLDPLVSWRLVLSTDELRLVGKALRGQLKDEEIEEARNLADLISTHRISNAEHNHNEMQKLKRSMEERKP